jgi:hypothetical protein
MGESVYYECVAVCGDELINPLQLGLGQDYKPCSHPPPPVAIPNQPARPPGFIYLPSFAHSYAVTNSTEDKRQALAAAEVRILRL